MRRFQWGVMGMVGAMALGCTGADGKAGPAGAPGADGSVGPQGSEGAEGPSGTAGLMGTTGATGPQGDAGPAGLSNLTAAEQAELRDFLNSQSGRACEDLDLAPPAASDGVQLQMSAYFSEFFETEQCMWVRVPESGWNYNGQEIKYTPGSHHVLLWRSDFTEIPPEDNFGRPHGVQEGELFNCQDDHGGPSAMFDLKGVIGGSQNPEWAPARFPSDTANPVEGGTYALMNLHYLNPSPEGLNTCVKFNLFTIPDADVKRRADIIFWYNPFITVPAQGASAATASCPITKDILMLGAVQSHMHARGASYEANLLPAGGGASEQIFQTTDWETPTPIDYDAPYKAIAAGSHIEYTCNYNNLEDRVVHQGLETTDEMCMFIGAYSVPVADWDETFHKEMHNCANAYGFFAAAELTTGGSTACPATVGCWLTSGDGSTLSEDQQSCITDSCYPNEALGYLRCAGANQAACTTSCQEDSMMSVHIPQCTADCSSTQATATTDCQASIAEDQALCSVDSLMTAYQTACDTTCATDCGGDSGAACASCMSSCVTGHVTACVTEKVTDCVTTATKACVTGCVTQRVTDCTIDCLQGVECKTEWDACAAATTCN